MSRESERAELNDFLALDNLGVGIENLVTDSRLIRPGDTFLAYPGKRLDARRFIPQALAAGANAILWEPRGFAWDPAWQVPNLPVEGLRARAGAIADRVYGHPSRRLRLVGITGTNGKTSCSHWIAQALSLLGDRTAVIGTLGNGFPEALDAATHTTPDAVQLQRILADYVRQGARCVAMEVSSHGIEQGRVNGSAFAVAVFTNLSRDHLDYHGSMETYAAVKARLFQWPGLGHAVLNLDDGYGIELSRRLPDGQAIIGYGFDDAAARYPVSEKRARLHGGNLRHDPEGMVFDVVFEAASGSECGTLETRLVGRFNASNLLAVLAVLLAGGRSLADALRALRQVSPVAGRMERVCDRPLVVVDYAHTPDALEQALTALREMLASTSAEPRPQSDAPRLTCVLGCGGERDPGKRPLMGAAATRFADEVILTSDNPRGEDPRAIISQIEAGASHPCHIEADRAAAIQWAIRGARAQDAVLIAGKGHETYQEAGGTRFPFSDVGVAREALQRLAAAAPAT